MIRKFIITLVGGSVLLAAIEAGASEGLDAQLTKQLSDIEIFNKTATVQLNADGTLTAQISPINADETYSVRGTWSIVDGKFCRRLTDAPKGVERRLCERIKIQGRKVSFDGLKPDGRKPVVYQIRYNQ